MKIFLPLILIVTMSTQTQASNNNVTIVKNPSTENSKANALTQKPNITSEKKMSDQQGIEGKPKIELEKDRDKYPGVEWKPKEGKNKYPGVEWKPKEGDPIPNQNDNAYPGVEWTPKK